MSMDDTYWQDDEENAGGKHGALLYSRSRVHHCPIWGKKVNTYKNFPIYVTMLNVISQKVTLPPSPQKIIMSPKEIRKYFNFFYLIALFLRVRLNDRYVYSSEWLICRNH